MGPSHQTGNGIRRPVLLGEDVLQDCVGVALIQELRQFHLDGREGQENAVIKSGRGCCSVPTATLWCHGLGNKPVVWVGINLMRTALLGIYLPS